MLALTIVAIVLCSLGLILNLIVTIGSTDDAAQGAALLSALIFVLAIVVMSIHL